MKPEKKHIAVKDVTTRTWEDFVRMATAYDLTTGAALGEAARLWMLLKPMLTKNKSNGKGKS